MQVNLQIENGWNASGLTINPVTAVARYSEGPSTNLWPGVNPPERIIQRDQTIDFSVSFDVSGLMQSLLAGCKWRVNLYLERYGVQEFALPAAVSQSIRVITPGEATPAAATYNVVFPTIPANTIPEGVYDVVCMVRLLNPGNLPLPVAMFGDFATIEVYGA